MNLSQVASYKARIAALKAKHAGKMESVAGTGLMAVGVMVGAGLCGVAKGKFGGWDVVGVPGDAALGLAGVGASMGGFFGKHSDFATAVACGALASYATTMGAALGAKMGTGQGLGIIKKLGAVSGVGAAALPEASSSEIDELVAAAQQTRVA
jgi:hypothetical protein